jgi:hypothetical protein
VAVAGTGVGLDTSVWLGEGVGLVGVLMSTTGWTTAGPHAVNPRTRIINLERYFGSIRVIVPEGRACPSSAICNQVEKFSCFN